MKATKVSVTVGQVFNIGNYQSCRVEANLEATIEPDETEQQAFEKCYIEAKKAFAKLAANFVPKKENGK